MIERIEQPKMKDIDKNCPLRYRLPGLSIFYPSIYLLRYISCHQDTTNSLYNKLSQEQQIRKSDYLCIPPEIVTNT